MAEDDITWIKNAINICIEQNEKIKANKDMREDRLYNEILEELKSARLIQLLYSIDDSHGEITKRHNLEVIDSFVDMNVYSVTRKFDGFGTSAGRVWYLDGEKYDISNINTWIKELKKTSINLKDAITTTGEKRYYESYAHGMTTLKFDTISKLGDDFVNVTNSFIYKAKSAFEGTGLRSGKDDSIVNALEEVLKVELKNIEEIGQVVFNIADMAEAISMNFQNIDEEISKCIEKGSSIQYLKTSNMPTSYEAYLEENHILDDVKDIMEAFEMQVEESSERLANDVLQSYEPLINRTYDTTFKNIIESFEEFNDVIEGLDEKIYSNIKSEKWEEVWGEGNGLAPTAKKVKYDHGTLASNLPSGIGDNIRYAKKNIKPLLENFYQSMTIAKIFQENVR